MVHAHKLSPYTTVSTVVVFVSELIGSSNYPPKLIIDWNVISAGSFLHEPKKSEIRITIRVENASVFFIKVIFQLFILCKYKYIK